METERLILRRAKPEDAKDLFEIRNSEYVLKYNAMVPWNFEKTKEQVIEDLKAENTFYIELKETNNVIGTVCLEEDSLRYKVNSFTLAYYLGEKYASKGYMTEALKTVIDYAFSNKNADVVSARVFSENKASLMLMKKLGFVNEGCIRRCVSGYNDIVYDDMIFSMLKEEYAAIR